MQVNYTSTKLRYSPQRGHLINMASVIFLQEIEQMWVKIQIPQFTVSMTMGNHETVLPSHCSF